MHFCDSHAHISALPDPMAVLERAKKVGVDRIINICTDRATLEKGLTLPVANAGATTPHDVEKEGDLDFPVFEQAAREKKLVAIGETGLDYHYVYSDKKIQQKFLIRYLHLAAEWQLPVIFHCREAFDDLFHIVDQEYRGHAILHCFTGTRSEAERVWERGWYLSLSGIVTFKKSEALREIAKIAPAKQLLIETDTPYLAPQSKRGQHNEPAFIVETAACIAEVREVPLEAIAKITRQNAIELFHLPN